ncbi:MAG: DUF3887 domain-containing protein, partial [Petrotogales bacterium]
MKKSLVIIFLVAIFSVVFGSSDDLKIANKYINAFFGKNFELVYDLQNETVKAQFSLNAMEGTHQYVINNYGNPVSVIKINQDTQDVYKIFVFYMKFENAYLNVNVVLDQNKKVAQFLIQPAPAPSNKPDYANPDSFNEMEVTFGEEPWKITGLL